MVSDHGVLKRECEMYLPLVLNKAVSICNLDAQVTGQPAYVITQPDQDLDVMGSF